MGSETLKMYYGGATMPGGALPSYALDAGATTRQIIGATIPDGDYVGAIGRITAGTALGTYFHVKAWDNSTKTLTTAHSLPSAPAAGDTVELIVPGLSRSAAEILPVTVLTGPVDVTGVVIDRAAAFGGEGDGTLVFTYADLTLAWQAPDDTLPGPSVDVSAGGAFLLQGESDDNWLEVTVTAGTLPASDQSDTITLEYAAEILLPAVEGYETLPGTTRYYDLWFTFSADAVNLDLSLADTTSDDNTLTFAVTEDTDTTALADLTYGTEAQPEDLTAGDSIRIAFKEVVAEDAAAFSRILDNLTINWE